jgi:hypothetical protein
MPPKKSKLSSVEGKLDTPIDGACFFRASATHDKERLRSTYTVTFYDREEENSRNVVHIGGNRHLSILVKDTDGNNIKELILRKALEK